MSGGVVKVDESASSDTGVWSPPLVGGIKTSEHCSEELLVDSEDVEQIHNTLIPYCQRR